MEKLDILIWVMGGGFTLMLVLWNHMNSQLTALKTDMNSQLTAIKTDMDGQFADVRGEIKELRGDVKDIDRRLCRLEGSFASKDCCMIKDARHLEKAE